MGPPLTGLEPFRARHEIRVANPPFRVDLEWAIGPGKSKSFQLSGYKDSGQGM